ncbi:MAG TPA: hypothetical protein VGE52_10470, partial [Pirellulales bacterium]
MSAGELAQPNDDAPGGPSPDPAAPENRPVSDSTEALESGLGVDNAAPVGSAAPVETGAPAEPQNSPDVELEALLEDWSFDELAPIPPRFHIHATFASRWKTNDGQGKLIRDEDGLPCLPLEAWLPALHDASLLAAEALDAGRPNGSRWRAWHDYLFGGSGHSGAFAVGRLRIPNRLRERLRVKPGQHDEHAMPRLRALLTTTVASSSGESSEAGVAGAVLSAEAQWTPPADRVRALACTSLLAVAMQLVEQLGDDPRHGFGRVSLSISGFKNTSLAARWLDSHRVPPTRTGRDVLPLPDVSPAADPVLAASEQVAASADAPTSPAAAEAHGHANEGDPDSASDSTDAAFDGSSGENETDAQGEALPEHRRRHRGDHGRDRIHPEEDDAYPTAALI